MKFTKTKLAKLHKDAIKQYEAIQDKERKSRAEAIEDNRFTHVVGAQSEDSFDKREDVYRGEVNRVAGLVDQVTGAQREDRSSIKYLPNGTQDDDVAEVKTGMARNFENISDAHSIYDQSFQENVTGGYGGWGILTEFEEGGFDQIPKFRGIQSAASSLFFDVNAVEYTRKDAKHAFLITGIHSDLFKSEYPDATISEFPAEKFSNANWFTVDVVKIAEYWWKQPYTRKLGQLSDGRVVDLEEEKDVIDDLALKGISVIKTREEKWHKVFMAKMNGAEFLSEPKEFPSKFIPLIPEYGRVTHIEDETYVRGLIRFAKDAQRIYNMETSNQVQVGSEMMDDPIWASAAQIKGREKDYEKYKVERPPVMIYTPDELALGPPRRTGAPSAQPAAMSRIKQAEMDIYATTNMYPPSLGLNVGLESGVALKHQDDKGDRGKYVFVDNHMKSIKYSAEILQDIMSRIMDTERVVEIMGIDDTVDTVTINQMQTELGEPVIDRQTGETVMVNNITPTFRTVVDVSKAYSTRKEESLEQLKELIGADETFKALSTDLVAKNSSILESDELHKRARRYMVTQGLIEPTDEEIEEFGLDQGPPPPSPQEQAIIDNVAMDTEQKMSEIELNDAKHANTVADTQSKATTNYKTLVQTLKDKVETGIPVTSEDVNALQENLAMIELANDAVKIP